MDFERELGWEDEISKESEFVLLPEGDYDFTVVNFSRGRFAGSAKLPACNKAELKIEVRDNKCNKATINHDLYLHTKTEGLLSAFFIAIGQKKHGEPLKMNWNAVVGAQGRCKVVIDTWTGNDGSQRQNNKISKFYEPQQSATQQTTFKAGQF